jgi:transcriptional regulator with XRE-family HTH domain
MTQATAVTTLGQKVAELRAARGWSLGALASRAALSPVTLSAVERGHTAPSLRTAVKLARALDVPVEVLASCRLPEPRPA